MSTPSPDKSPTARAPRRLVLLQEAEHSGVEKVLQEYAGNDVSGTRLHADLQRQAGENPGRFVAAEWLGSLQGWKRFLWCKK